MVDSDLTPSNNNSAGFRFVWGTNSPDHQVCFMPFSPILINTGCRSCLLLAQQSYQGPAKYDDLTNLICIIDFNKSYNTMARKDAWFRLVDTGLID